MHQKTVLDYKGKNIYIIGGAVKVTSVYVEDERVHIQEFKDKVAEHHNIESMPHSNLTAVYGNERVETMESLSK